MDVTELHRQEKKGSDIFIAIAGVGNCASALVQGINYYRTHSKGLMFPKIGRYLAHNIKPVVAFDVDSRKVGKQLEDAIFSKPNCADIFQSDIEPTGVTVQMGPILDGVPGLMAEYSAEESFQPAAEEPVNIANELKKSGASVLICYLPVGSEDAVKTYANACLAAGVAMVNCVPVFIASNQDWNEKFRHNRIPIIGDDIKSQVGATIVHRTLTRLFSDRGVTIDRMYQLNTGGNADFLNMLDRSRLKSKKRSKTNSVIAQLSEPIDPECVHIGPSDYVRWQRDNKVAFIRIEGRGFGGCPVEVELRLSVQDSPNSAGVAIDAIRCAQLGLDQEMSGALVEPSAYYMKTPPREMRDESALSGLRDFINKCS